MVTHKRTLMLRVSETMMERLDEWRRAEKDLPSRPEAAIRMLDQYLPQPERELTKHGRAA